MNPFCPRPIPGIPRSPLPICGRRAHLPSSTLTEHLADHDDPHRVRDLVPAMRIGSGAPSVEASDKETDFYFDSSEPALYVLRDVGSGVLRWELAASGPGGGSPAAAVELARQLAGLSHEASALTEDEKDVLLEKLADYVVAKESMGS